MKKQGYKIKAYEPFQYTPKKGLDINKVVTQIKEIEQDIIQNGLYDVVILDSVINSVINLDMLNYVLITCNSLLKENGILIATTRSDKTRKVEEAKTAGYNGLKIWFEDDNKFNVRINKHGNPIVQFLPSEDFIKPIINQYFNHCSCKPYSNTYLKIICSNKIRLNNKETYNIALNTEFNMLYPNGYQHNQHKKLVETILKYNGF